jgi:hypothetical protein
MHLVCTQSYSQHSHSPLTFIIATSRVAPFARPPHMHVILICQSPRLSQRAASRHSVRWQLLRMNPGLCLFVCAHCCGLRRVFVNRVGLSAPSHAQSCNELHITVLCTAPRPLSLICVCLAGATSKSIADAHRQLARMLQVAAGCHGPGGAMRKPMHGESRAEMRYRFELAREPSVRVMLYESHI